MILLDNVHTSLILSSSRNVYSQSYLFHCANYWAAKGDRVMYISRTPVNNLPPSINKENEELNPEIFSRIRFMYLPRWQDLLRQLYSVHLHPHPVSLIIVEQLDHYCNNEENDNTSLICASIINGAAICANKTSKPSYVICDYFSGESLIQMTIIKNYFNNLWCLRQFKETFKLIKLTSKTGEISEIELSMNSEKPIINIEKIFKKVEETKDD